VPCGRGGWHTPTPHHTSGVGWPRRDEAAGAGGRMSGAREGPARTASAGRGAGGRGRGSAPRVALGSVIGVA